MGAAGTVPAQVTLSSATPGIKLFIWDSAGLTYIPDASGTTTLQVTAGSDLTILVDGSAVSPVTAYDLRITTR